MTHIAKSLGTQTKSIGMCQEASKCPGTRDGKAEGIIRPEKKEDKLMHRSGKKKEAPEEEKIQPLCWPKGPRLESRKETALSSPRNDALSAGCAAIPA